MLEFRHRLIMRSVALLATAVILVGALAPLINTRVASAATYSEQSALAKIMTYDGYTLLTMCYSVSGGMHLDVPAGKAADMSAWNITDGNSYSKGIPVPAYYDIGGDGNTSSNEVKCSEFFGKYGTALGITDPAAFLKDAGFEFSGGTSATFNGCRITGTPTQINQRFDTEVQCLKQAASKRLGIGSTPPWDDQMSYIRNKQILDAQAKGTEPGGCFAHWNNDTANSATFSINDWLRGLGLGGDDGILGTQANPEIIKLVDNADAPKRSASYITASEGGDGNDGWTKTVLISPGYKNTTNNALKAARAVCQDLARELSSLSGKYVAWAEANPDANQGVGSTTPQQESAEEFKDNCPLEAGAPMRWLGCSVFAALKGAADALADQLDAYLYTDPAIFDARTQQAATAIRNIGMALVLIAGLIMVISQAFGFEFLDAYTIRKLLPKLGIALIGMALAWPLLKLAVTLTNDLGGMVYSLFLELAKKGGGTGDVVGAGSTITAVISGVFVAGGAILVLGALGVLSLLGTVVLALLIGILVLSVRQLVIFMAIILAPLAIAAYVIPGGEKLWKFWKTTLITTLVMYPLIMGFIGAGAAMAALMPKPNDRMSILAIIVYFAPYFMLPFAFKLAGGLMSTIFSIANDKNRGMFDRLKKFRGNRSAENWQKIKAGNRWQGNPIGERASRALQTASLYGTGKGGVNVFNPQKMRGKVNAARSAFNTAATQKAAENPDVAAALSDDGMIDAANYGARTYDSALRYFREHGDDERTARLKAGMIDRAKRVAGSEVFYELAAVKNAGTKTGYGGGAHEMFDAINRAAGKDDVKRARMIGAAREAAKAAGRVDLYGGSYGDAVDIAKLQQEDLTTEQRAEVIGRSELRAQRRREQGEVGATSVLTGLRPDQRIEDSEIEQLMARSILRNNNVYEIAGGHYIGTQRMAAAIETDLAQAQTNLTDAINAGGAQPSETQQAAIDKARHEYIRQLAHYNVLTTVAGQSSQRNAETLGTIMGQTNTVLPTQQVTIEAPVLGPNNQPILDGDGQPVVERQTRTVEVGSSQWRELGGQMGTGTLRDAVLNAETGTTEYHLYAQSFLAPQAMHQAQAAQLSPAAAGAATAAANAGAAAAGFVPPGAPPGPGG